MQVESLQDGVAAKPGQLPVDAGPQLVGAGHSTPDDEAVRDGVEEGLRGVQVARTSRRDVLGGRRVDDHGVVVMPPHAVEALRQTVDERRRPEGVETGPGGTVKWVVGRGQLVMSDTATQNSELVVG